ncbi:Fanconi-associated nuclease 1 [Talaromyces islandicus]|uniref:Fanconi-associated nuclease n=1 Tax=Talaromyces islandicus TaxID=28573 RepID=A0A0U1LTB8_TALIS|nr:Fanconi-associated nuclease 1 [Talaromyces islandicus]
MPSLLDFFETRRPVPKRAKLSDEGPQDSAVSSDGSHGTDRPKSEDSPTPLIESDYSALPADATVGNDVGNEDAKGSQTELETSLPLIEADQEAIEQYESSKATAVKEEQLTTLQRRLGERKWQKGRSSIYVDAFNLALETVLEDEAHLFDEPELEVFNKWKNLSYEAQYLYVRLFLRKTAAWHRINRLGYYQDIADMPQAVAGLRHVHTLPPSTSPADKNPTLCRAPTENSLSSSFRFAEGIEQISTLEEASSLLLLDELKTLAREAKVQGKNKTELLMALRQASQTQGGLAWESENYNRNSHFQQKILDITGDCIRLSPAPLKLFERVHLVFYRSTEWTEKSLTTIILAKMSRKNFPEYIVSRSTSIFPSRVALLEFEAALRIQFDIDNILEFSGTPTAERLHRIKDLSDNVYMRWQNLLEEEQRKEDSIYVSGEGAYLHRFSPAWVYTRIIHKGLHPLARFKEHKREHKLLTELLAQKFFHTSRRGSWYQRKALLEEHYMWALTPNDDRSDELQKKFWKRVALKTCETGLQDPDCHIIYHYDLQKRVMKLEKSLKVVKREQHDFGHVLLTKPEQRTIEGIRIEKEESLSRAEPKPTGDPSTSTTRRGHPTVWVDEREDSGECRVENMCLSWYRDNGWKGYHSEGGIVRTLFGYLFYDILFTYVPNVFQTPFQTCPLDLHTDAFYPTRASEINHRLVQIANGEAESIILDVHGREFHKQTCVVGVDWTFPIDDLVEIVQCFRGSALATVCKVMAQEYQQRGGGIPDLFLWSTAKKEVLFAEVKSENDRLSDTQRLWIHVLTGAGIRVELCNAVAKEVRYV